jgi:eukaryotic-like serine/threonine-protein kinase
VSGGLQYIGKYRLLKQLHASRTGEVWEARDDTANLRVVVKYPNRDFRKDRNEIASLKREFEVGSMMKHKNAIEVYEFSTFRGTPYVVMEHFLAPNMKQAIRTDHDALYPLATEIVQTAAEGLSFFHSQGWVHCDVKPDNFLVGEGGLTKLIDYSIARKPTGMLSSLFGGKRQGTRSYMAPEQIRAAAIDQRADVYSFGCTLFELCTGRLPFTGVSPDELLTKHLKAPVPAAIAANELVTQEFSNLIGQLMAKERNDRPQSIDQFLNAFRNMRVFRARKV